MSILLFFILTIFSGFIIDLIIKKWKADLLEKIIIRFGVGLGIIPILGVILNLLSIPLDWKIFLIISIAIFLLSFYFRKENLLKEFRNLDFGLTKITKNQIYTFFVFIMFFITAYMYISGSFAYPWFEDGDPYGYASDIKYITLEKTYSADMHFCHYAEPYPQGYQILMGILHQTNDSIYFTMKFFSSLIISFSILFFFYFVKIFSKKVEIAFWSTFCLFAIPAWLSHFIFPLAFNMTLMIILFYSLINISESKNWKYLSIILYASILITHFYTGVIISVLLILYYLNKVFVEEKFNKDVLDVLILGFLTSLLFWMPSLYKFREVIFSTNPPELGGIEIFFPFFSKVIAGNIYSIVFFGSLFAFALLYISRNHWFKYIKKGLSYPNIKYKIFFVLLIIALCILVIPQDKIIYAKGSADRIYNISDFFIVQNGNMINNPIGIGIILMSIFLIGFSLLSINIKKLFLENNFYLSTSYIWTIFSFIGIMGVVLSIGFAPFRMWTFFGMCLSLMVGYTIYEILKSIKFTFKEYETVLRFIFISLLIISVYFTSFQQKYWHNTAPWPEHQIMVPKSQELYIWMREGGLPKNTMVDNICHRPSLVIGYDMLSKPWSNEEVCESATSYYHISLNKTVEDNYNFLKRNNFSYVVIGASCIAKYNVNPELVNIRIQEFINSTKFKLIKNTETEYLFKVI